MPPEQDEQTEKEDETVGDQLRNGHPVIKTTLEIDKVLYVKMKQEIARSNTSIRDFLSDAAKEKLASVGKARKKEGSDAAVLERAVKKNPIAKKVLDILELEVLPPFSIALLLAKLERFDIEPDDFSLSDLTEEMVNDLVRPVDFLSGPVAAKNIEVALKALRSG